DVGCACRAHVARIENVYRRDVADDRAACPRALDDDRLLVAEVFIGALSRGRVGLASRRVGRLLGRGRDRLGWARVCGGLRGGGGGLRNGRRNDAKKRSAAEQR